MTWADNLREIIGATLGITLGLIVSGLTLFSIGQTVARMIGLVPMYRGVSLPSCMKL